MVRESLQPPSPRRDDALVQAIELLELATDDNRQFWQDILECRRLLAETPKSLIQEAMNAELGFILSEPSLFTRMQSTIRQYAHAQALVARTKETDRYQKRLDELTQNQNGNLETVISQAKTLQEKSQQLEMGLSQYLQRLQSYLSAYQKAKAEGFFVQDRHHHALSIALLRNRIRDVKALQPKLQKVATRIRAAGVSFENIAKNELERLKNGYQFKEEDFDTLEKKLAMITYPPLTRDNFPVRFDKIASAEISPIIPPKDQDEKSR